MLEIKNISAGYGKDTVLDGVNAIVNTGRLTSIIGINGSGKSTLLKSILGIIPVRCGEIALDSHPLSSMSRNETAKRIAYLAQGRNTPDMTVEQLVLHGRFPYLSYPRRYTECDREIARGAMEALGISELGKKHLGTLSGGMRQNAYIAMALAQDTDYILLDEPTTYLDVSHQIELMRTLQKLARDGKGIAIVMHDLPLAFQFSDEIIVLNDKTVAAQTTPHELCRSSLIKEVFGISVAYEENEKNFYYSTRA